MGYLGEEMEDAVVEKLLELLEQDCTMSIEQMAAAAGMPVDEAKAAIRKY